MCGHEAAYTLRRRAPVTSKMACSSLSESRSTASRVNRSAFSAGSRSWWAAHSTSSGYRARSRFAGRLSSRLTLPLGRTRMIIGGLAFANQPSAIRRHPAERGDRSRSFGIGITVNGRGKAKAFRLLLPNHMPRRHVTHQAACSCPACGSDFIHDGETVRQFPTASRLRSVSCVIYSPALPAGAAIRSSGPRCRHYIERSKPRSGLVAHG